MAMLNNQMVFVHSVRSLALTVRRWPGDVGHPSGSAGRACRSQKCGTIGKAKFRFQMIQMVPSQVVTSMTYDASFYEFLSGKCCFL